MTSKKSFLTIMIFGVAFLLVSCSSQQEGIESASSDSETIKANQESQYSPGPQKVKISVSGGGGEDAELQSRGRQN